MEKSNNKIYKDNTKDENNIQKLISIRKYNIYKINKVKNNTGITLITLVITIIIIIILSAITINAALGDNGLIRQAQLAKEMAENSTKSESEKMNQLAQEYANMMSEDAGGGIEEPEVDTTPPTVTIIEGEITQNSITVNVTANDPESGLASENAYVYYLNGLEYTRNNLSSCKFTGLSAETPYTIKVEVYNGIGLKGEDSITLTTSAKPGISAGEIQKNPTAYYGAEVLGYSTGHSETTEAVTTWRIFYAGPEPGGTESNIYLIANDYIKGSVAPKSVGNHSVNSSGEYIWFVDIVEKNDYSTGGSWIKINSKAKSWLNKYLSSSYGMSTNNNMKVVSYLMDTNVWSSYAGSNAEYAIGGPTLELFCASYKDTHQSRWLECDSVNQYGYQIKWSDGSYGYSVSGLTQNEYNEIYIKSDNSKTEGMRLASPTASSSNHSFYANYDGSVDCNNYSSDYLGLRPIVCLKSEVQLEAQGDGTYAIIQ